MGGFLGGVAKTAVGVAPYAAAAIANQQRQDLARKQALMGAYYQQQSNDRANRLNTAQVDALNTRAEGQWGSAFSGQDENGPGMFQQHKLSGVVRRVQVQGAGTPSAPPAPSSGAGIDGMDGMDAGTSNDAGSPAAPSPAQAPSQAPSVVRPFVKPVAPPKAEKIDPNSPEGVAAAGQKAKTAAAARAQYAQPKAAPLVKVVGPDGSTIYTPQSQASGMNAPTAAGGMGGASLSPEDRGKMLQQAKLDNATMKAYEQKVLSGQAKVGTAAGVAGATAAAHGGTMANVMSVLGNAATGAIDPEYQRYLTAQRSYGRIMGNLQSKRYTDHQAEIERSISGLQGNDLAGTIQYKQQLRDASLAEPQNSGGRGGAPAASPSTGNIDLRQPSPTPTAAPKATKNDYGIFGKPPGGDE